MDPALVARRSRLRLMTVAFGLLLVGLGGYIGFVAFVESGSIGGLGAGTGGLAVATGFAGFFSPCSFPLLLTFLARQHQADRRRVVVSSLGVGLGALFFFLVIAALLALTGEALTRVVGFDALTSRVFRVAIGALLIFLGLRQASLIKTRLTFFDSVAGGSTRRLDASGIENQTGRDFVYGFGYLLAGFG